MTFCVPGLVPVQINGQPIVKGRKITAFSNAEEDAVQLSSSMPFMLETKLIEQGGQFTAAPLWEKHVVVGSVIESKVDHMHRNLSMHRDKQRI